MAGEEVAERSACVNAVAGLAVEELHDVAGVVRANGVDGLVHDAEADLRRCWLAAGVACRHHVGGGFAGEELRLLRLNINGELAIDRRNF